MPIYEYRCRACGKEFEELVFSAGTEVCCPECGAEKVERLLSVVSFSTDRGFRSSTSSGSCSGCAGGSCHTCGH